MKTENIVQGRPFLSPYGVSEIDYLEYANLFTI